MTHADASKQPENRHGEQRNRRAEQPARDRHRAIERTAPPGRDPDKNERRLQGKPADRRELYSVDDPHIVHAQDGSNTALQFSGKRVRTIHIDTDTGAIEPVTEWQPLDARDILAWVRVTTPTAAQSTGTFLSLGAAL